MSKQTYNINLKSIELESANDEQKSLLERSKKNNGMIPNMYKNMVNLPGLQDTYDVGYQHFRKSSGFTSQEQEVVFVTVSMENACGYCAAAHSFIADNMSNVPTEITNAIREGKELPDAKLNALSEFTKIMFESRGNPTEAEAKTFLKAGYTDKHILGIILALAVKTISNYSNHVFHTEIDEAFQGRKLETV
jgi:uncharacterized peroxidase-related enzyme